MRDSYLFFKDENFESILNIFDFLDFFRNDVSPQRADVCFLLDSAAKGDINSMFFYGKLLHKGCIFTNGKEDNKQAFEIFAKLAEKGHLESIYKVGRMMYKGYSDVKRNSFQYFKKAAKQGHIKAAHYLSKCYLKGIGCQKNIEKYMNWLITSAAMNCAKAKNQLARELKDSINILDSDQDTCAFLIHQSAQMGNLFALGAFGCGCLQEYEKEKKTKLTPDWLNESQKLSYFSEQKISQRMLEMGNSMLNSFKVMYKKKIIKKKKFVNYQKQGMYEQKANFENNSKCQFKIGIIYLEKDFDKAMIYFSMSAKNKYPDAMHVIAAFNEWHNLNLSISQYIRASYEGSKKSMVRLAQIYIKKGSNMEEAIRYLWNSVAAESKKGFKEIGYLYYKGIFLPKNKTIACEYFIQSNNHTVSQYYMAKMYEKGIVLPKNKEKAIHYYRLAATDIFRPKAAKKLNELTNGKEKVEDYLPNKCLSKDTKNKYSEKHLYYCYTCGIVVYAICAYCAKYCHNGHDIVDVGIREMRCCCKLFSGCK